VTVNWKTDLNKENGHTNHYRLILTPMELLPALKYSLPVFGVMLLSNQFVANPFDKMAAMCVADSTNGERDRDRDENEYVIKT